MPFFQLGAWGPIKTSLVIVTPEGSLVMVSSRVFATRDNCVAHALEDVWIVKTPSIIEMGVACAAMSTPTIVDHVINKFPSAKPLSHSRSEIKLYPRRDRTSG